jgi:hypothetical protein
VATKRSTFQKRQRENDLKDKARAKEARRAAKRAGVLTPKPDETTDPNDPNDPNTNPGSSSGTDVALPPPTPPRSTDSA